MYYKIENFLMKFYHEGKDFHDDDVLTNIAILTSPYLENDIQLQIEDRYDGSPNKDRYLFTFRLNEELGKFETIYVECNYDERFIKTNDMRIINHDLLEVFEDKIIDTLELFGLI